MINNKNAVTLLIEPISSVRSMMGQVLKSFGIKDIMSVSSVKEAIRSLEVGKVEWLVAPPLIHEQYNILHFLELFIREPSLRKVKTTLMLEPDTELALLPMAFQLGLMSWINHKTIYNDLQHEFEELSKVCQANNNDFVLVSSVYIRKYSFKSRQYQNLVTYERNLLHYYPSNTNLLLNLANTLISLHQQDQAKTILQQSLVIDDTLKNKIAKICEKYDIELTKVPEGASPYNAFNLKSVIVIDPDTDVLSNIKEILESVGAEGIQCFTTADEAYAYMESAREPSLIISEWRVPGVLGAILIQRIRNLRWFQVPILIVSYKVKASDRDILNEFGVDFVLTKPFSRVNLLRKIAFLLQENRIPSEQGSYESRIIRLSQRGRVVESEKLLNDAKNNKNISNEVYCRLEAFIAFATKKYPSCITKCRDYLKRFPHDTLTLHLLGKTYLKTHQYKEALACFDKAAEKSPDNIERLILMSETEELLDNEASSDQHLDKAVKLDKESILVKVAQCKKLLKGKDKELQKKAAKEIDNYTMLVSSINNYAVSIVHARQYPKAIDLYLNAINILPKDEVQNKKVLIYNLALAYVRNDQIDASAPLLKGLADLESKAMLDKKISSLYSKVRHALKKGEELIIPLDAEVSEKDQESLDDVLTINPGDLCSYLIYFDVAGIGKKYEIIDTDKISHFKPFLSRFDPEELNKLKKSS